MKSMNDSLDELKNMRDSIRTQITDLQAQLYKLDGAIQYLENDSHKGPNRWTPSKIQELIDRGYSPGKKLTIEKKIVFLLHTYGELTAIEMAEKAKKHEGDAYNYAKIKRQITIKSSRMAAIGIIGKRLIAGQNIYFLHR